MLYPNTKEMATTIGWNRVSEYCIGDPSKKFVVHDHRRGQFYYTDEDHVEHLDGIRAMAMMDQVAIDLHREGKCDIAEQTLKASAGGDQSTFKKLHDIMARNQS
jgi:hypothetical protein